MAQEKPLDVRAEAYRFADRQIRKALVAKGAGSGAVPDRDVLAVIYAAVLEVVHDAFGSGPRVGWSGELVTKSAAGGMTGLAAAAVDARVADVDRQLRKTDKQLRKIGKKLRLVAEQENARQELAAEQEARLREKLAEPQSQASSRPMTGADVAKMRYVMNAVATAEGQYAEKIAKVNGHGPAPGQEGASNGKA